MRRKKEKRKYFEVRGFAFATRETVTVIGQAQQESIQ